MKSTRREFLQTAAATSALLSLGAYRPVFASGEAAVPCGYDDEKLTALCELMRRDSAMAQERAGTPMKILVLGGTSFLGPACVELALARGHEVTLFNRGRTNTHLFPQLEKIQGDRGEGHEALAGREWGVVLDTSAYYPRVVDGAMEVLKNHVKHYTLVSTISVYASFETVGMDETAAVAVLEDPTTEEVTGESYGGLKALCEQAAERHMPGRVHNVRPGLIVGPMDRTDRFSYWPVRVARGGEVLAPNEPSQGIQFIDVRDLAAFIVMGMEDRLAGVYNAVSAPNQFTIGSLLETCKKVSGSDATFTWCPPDFLEAQEVAAWSDMPVWVPPTGEFAGMDQVKVDGALAAGMEIRSADLTVRDTLDWWKSKPETADEEIRTELRAGIKPYREVEVLAAWREKNAG